MLRGKNAGQLKNAAGFGDDSFTTHDLCSEEAFFGFVCCSMQGRL